MKIYEKPLMTVESLLSETQIANDVTTLGELDPISGEEVSIPAPDNWYDY